MLPSVERRHTLKQGNCKNAFCQGILLDDEITIVKPPIGDPDAKLDEYWLLKRTLYGLRRIPRHWFSKISAILNSMGLKSNASDPCMFTGSIVDPSNPSADIPTTKLTLGIYVDDFVYFSEDPEVECHFQRILSNYVTVDFMGTVDWFLGTHFQWSISSDKVAVQFQSDRLRVAPRRSKQRPYSLRHSGCYSLPLGPSHQRMSRIRQSR